MTIKTALREVNNAVLDLQSADYNTFERPLERLARALNGPDLKDTTDRLRAAANFDNFLGNASKGGSMLGSARLNWPADRQEELGLVIEIIERGAKDPHWFLNLAHTYYYSGRKIVGDIRKITTAVIIPFNRDFASYFDDQMPDAEQGQNGSHGGVTYNIGTMHNSPLQHVSPGGHGTQTTTYSSDDLRSVVALYRQHVDELRLDDVQRRRADAQVATIEAQLIDEPDPSIIRSAGRSLKTIVEGAIGGAAGTAIAAAPVWAPLLSMFG